MLVRSFFSECLTNIFLKYKNKYICIDDEIIGLKLILLNIK